MGIVTAQSLEAGIPFEQGTEILLTLEQKKPKKRPQPKPAETPEELPDDLTH